MSFRRLTKFVKTLERHCSPRMRARATFDRVVATRARCDVRGRVRGAVARARATRGGEDVRRHVPWTGGLEIIFSADERDVLAGASRGAPLDALSAPWRLMLLSDGSVTRHLSVLGRSARTEVEVVESGARRSDDDDDDAPRDVKRLGEGILRREVFLRARGTTGAGEAPAVYAASWWNEEAFRKFMPDEGASMWANLRNANVELHREIREVYLGKNERLEEAFGERGPFWARHYIFWHDGAPITVVYEVFNPALSAVLGRP